MFITSLQSHQVFVFGTNAAGFHGAGAAGYAFSGTTANDWRTCPLKQAAIRSHIGSLERIGKWCVWGVAQGLMTGYEGCSWGIVTVEVPGRKQSTTLQYVRKQVEELRAYATLHTELEFLVTPLAIGYAGYNEVEVECAVWSKVVLPKNVRRL